MAREVLSNPISVAEADPRIAVTRPDMSGPATIEALGELGGEAIAGVQAGRTERKVSEVADAFSTSLEMKEQGIKYNEDGTLSPETIMQANQQLQSKLTSVEGEAAARLKRLSLATEQGRYHGSLAARIEMEKEVRQLMSQTPGFEREIRQTAASVLGFDPTGAAIRQLLDIQAPGPKRETLLDKFEQEVDRTHAQYKSVGINISRQTVHQILSQSALRQQNNAMLKSQIEQGDINADQAVDRMLRTEVMSPFGAAVAQMGRDKGAGVIRGWEDTENIVRSVEAAEQATLQRTLEEARSLGGTLSISTERRIREWNAERYAPIKELFKNESVSSVLTKRFEEVNLLSKAAGWEMAPEIMFMNTAFGPQITGTLIDVMANSMTTGGFSMLSQYMPTLANLFGRDALADGTAVQTMGSIARRIFNGDTTPVFGKNGTALDTETLNRIETELANTMATQAQTPQDFTQVIAGLKDNRPELALGILAKDPNSFSQVTPQQRQEVKSFLISDRALILGSVAETVSVTDTLSVNPETGMISSVQDAERPSIRKVAQGLMGSSLRGGPRGVTPNDPSSGAVVSLNHHLALLQNPQWRQYIMPEARSYEDALDRLDTELQLQHVRHQLADANLRSAGNSLQRKGISKEAWDQRIDELADRERRLNASLGYKTGHRVR